MRRVGNELRGENRACVDGRGRLCCGKEVSGVGAWKVKVGGIKTGSSFLAPWRRMRSAASLTLPLLLFQLDLKRQHTICAWRFTPKKRRPTKATPHHRFSSCLLRDLNPGQNILPPSGRACPLPLALKHLCGCGNVTACRYATLPSPPRHTLLCSYFADFS